MNELPQERLCIGIHACAHAEFMFEVTKQYVMQRKAYGKTLSNLQVHGHVLSSSFSNLTLYCNLVVVHTDSSAQTGRDEDGDLRDSGFYRSVHRVARKPTVRRSNGLHGKNLVKRSKTFGVICPCLERLFLIVCTLSRASELENKIAAQCVQLHGGAGYIMDSQIARSYTHARVQTIYGGSNEVLKDLIARQIIMPRK